MNNILFSWLIFLSSLLISIYAFILSLLCRIKLIKPLANSALILPPAAPGSLGDEAMVVASSDYLKKQGVTTISLVAFNINIKYPISLLEYLDMRDYFIYSNWYKFIQKAIEYGYWVSRYERFYCLGADLMDGYYSEYATFKRLKLVEIAAKCGLEVAILGFSFNEKPTPTAIKILQDLPSSVKICARDSVSQKRLETYVNRPIKLVADLAFLLSPDESSETVKSAFEWIKDQQQKERKVIGLNINNLVFRNFKDKSVEDLIQAYVHNITTLFSEGQQLSFVLLPHDFRSIQGNLSDVKVAEKFYKALPDNLKVYVYQISKRFSASEIKAIVGKLDVVLSARMHLAIACLGQETPVGCVSYQGKFEGLFKHFCLDPITIEPSEILESDSNKIAECILKLIKNQDSIHQQIHQKLPDVKKLSQSNFETFK